KTDLLKARAIGSDGAEIVGALREVRVMAGVQALPDRGFEVPHVDGVIDSRDDAVEVERAREHGVVLSTRRRCSERAAEPAEDGTLGEKAQELAALSRSSAGSGC